MKVILGLPFLYNFKYWTFWSKYKQVQVRHLYIYIMPNFFLVYIVKKMYN